MAAADLRGELSCSICQSIYKDPVTLRCGHNFCRVCVDGVLDTQEGSGAYTCPDCREQFQERPALCRNLTLCNIAERYLSTEPEQEDTGIFCNYCIHSPVPAVKSCLMCEASMCSDHLRVHRKSAEHVITEPNNSLRTRKCSVHNKLLQYYCMDDGTQICITCCLAGQHGGHQVVQLNEAYERRKKKLKHVLQKLTSKREQTEKRLHSLEERRSEVQEKAAGERERVTALFRDIRRQLEDLEKRVQSEISRREDQVLLTLCDLIQDLEVKKDELSMKMHIEELCNVTDPVTVFQEQESDREGFCVTEEKDNEDTEVGGDIKLHDVTYLDEVCISETIHRGLFDIIAAVKGANHKQDALDLLLDVNTAANNVDISEDMKCVSLSQIVQKRPETPERFESYQVLSTRSFSSGRHNWEILTSRSGGWRIGMTYPSVYREGPQSAIGDNNKSWCLRKFYNELTARHKYKEVQLFHNISCQKFRICLDYEAGQLSFYQLCDPIRHLHTFTATFTEPLHAAFYVWGSKAWVRVSK
ncbi:E3 ubiquitin/ISG15 ligase TRIM25-like isoform X1 [Mixophyes fleayi]|uniref:E3 ubiquitin/ISG15 ligase TRIM25-like isoform X1 n=2 Tax=Mixophyes fleayi TaxID=3061075 RepID=UPI003F4E3E7E